MRQVYFISHPEVVINAEVPITKGPLSDKGIDRMTTLLRLPWGKDIRSIYSSEEQKAVDGANIMAKHLSTHVTPCAYLGEMDCSSTGFLPCEEFESVADQFFAHPTESVRGW